MGVCRVFILCILNVYAPLQLAKEKGTLSHVSHSRKDLAEPRPTGPLFCVQLEFFLV